MQITFLGTGTSHGVPMAACNCLTCTSQNPYNQRFRSSILLEVGGLSILIDTPPELRLQLLRNKIKKLDAILFTHPHADHLMGFDDIRAINRAMQQRIPVYGNAYTLQEIKRVFPYIFGSIQQGGGLPQVSLHKIENPFKIGKLFIYPLPIKHGKLDILGYRIGPVAYLTDCSQIPAATFKLLQGVKLLILNALRFKPHPTHLNLEQALDLITELKPWQTYLTHISHSLENDRVNAQLPAFVKLAYDGLKIKIFEEGE